MSMRDRILSNYKKAQKIKWSLIIITFLLLSSCEYLFDFNPPDIKIISPSEGEQVSNSVIIEAEVKDENLEKTDIFINGNKEYDCKSEYINYTYILSSSGNYTIKLKAFDKAGNWSEEEVIFGVVPGALVLEAKEKTASTITIEWSKNKDVDFLFYAVYRDDLPGVDLNSKNLAIIYDQDDTTYTDTLLSPHSTYYYIVYVYNIDNLSAKSNVIEVTTLGLTNLTLGFDPRYIELNQGDKFSMTVWIESVVDLFGAAFEITFDNTILEADSVTLGDFLGSDVIFFEHYSADTISLAVTRKAGAGGVSGYGTLVDLYFHCVGLGTTTLNFTPDIALNKEDGSPVDGFSSLEILKAIIKVE